MPFNGAVRSGAVALVAVFVMGVGVFGQEPGLPAAQNAAPATGLILGQVIDVGSGKPVSGVTVQLNRVAGPRGQGGVAQSPVLTDSEGRFYFGRLLPGSYAFITTRTGYSVLSPQAVQRVVELGNGERITDVRVSVVKLAAINGTVRDEGGDPVVGVTVIAFRRGVINGRAVMQAGSQARSDDRGAYRVSNLQPGAYVICACGRDPIPFDGTLLTTLAAEPVQLLAMAARAARLGADVVQFEEPLKTSSPMMYPASPTVARADRLTMVSGEERIGVDLTLPAVRASRVSGTVIGAEGVLTAGSISLVAAGESDEGASLTRLTPMLVQPDGRFDFANVPSGSYMLRVQTLGGSPRGASPTGLAMGFLGSRGAPPPPPPPPPPVPGQAPAPNPILWAAVPITVGERDVTGLSVTVRPGMTVSGRVRMEDDKPLPSAQQLQRAGVQVLLLNPAPGVAGAASGRVGADGTFRAAFLMPGRHQVNAILPPPVTAIKSVEVDGVDRTDLPLDVDADVTDLVITMSDAPLAAVSGVVTGTQVAQGLTAILFPVDRRLWTDPAAATRRYRSVPVSRAGAFTMASLVAGDYFVAVVPDAQALDWQEAPRLEALSREAVKIVLAAGDKKAVEVHR